MARRQGLGLSQAEPGDQCLRVHRLLNKDTALGEAGTSPDPMTACYWMNPLISHVTLEKRGFRLNS